jgi:two-component system cell cycle response regulator
MRRFGLICASESERAADCEAVTIPLVIASVAAIALMLHMAWSLRGNARLLESTRTEAMTDVLTGLGNRRRMMADLERALAVAGPEAPFVLVLFDLDGFKHYNDTLGHLAGDALLARCGRALRDAVTGMGGAYRPGGDEFCVLLAPSGTGGTEDVVAACVAALSERSPGADIKPSWGAVLLPGEAEHAEDALGLADRRMYSRKGSGRRRSARRESIDVLLSVLQERRQEDLHEHSDSVAELARRVGERLGMPVGDVEETAHAAELHDIGKLAIPERVLSKPAPLTRDEWLQVHEHTIAGERILRAAPALEPVARLVRASHERWDGEGYPDGLSGAEIPLGARIISVCDAFDAMISERPYRTAMAVGSALDELVQCAGTQFDPEVVRAFGAVIAGDDPGATASAVAAAA